MHRSGTSALTGSLRALGLAAGDESQLIGPSKHNPMGHHEVRDLVYVNEMLLHDLGGTWYAPPPWSETRLVELAAGRSGSGAARLLRERLPGDGWVWKDPRLCLLVPFWRHLLGERLAAVMIVRAPSEVARSLAGVGRRSGDVAVSEPLALALWEHYNRVAIVGLQGVPTLLVHHHEIVADARRALIAIVAFLDGVGLRPDDPRLDDAVAVLGERPAGSQAPASGSLPPPVRALHSALLDVSGTVPAWLAPSLPEPSTDLRSRFDEARRSR
jgi:hypothetical protein